eukprot:252332_1
MDVEQNMNTQSSSAKNSLKDVDDEKYVQEEFVNETRLHLYKKKLRSLEAQKHILSEKIRARHTAQLHQIVEKQRRILQQLLSPLDMAINDTTRSLHSVFDEMETQYGTIDGMYCRACFDWKQLISNCNKCDLPICTGCAIRCNGPQCEFAFCADCNLQIPQFWIEDIGKHLCLNCRK